MDVRIQKTKQNLSIAIQKLLLTKSLDEISVTELCSTAGINRTTFYKYYTIPMDVVEEIIRSVIEDTFAVVRSTYSDDQFEDVYQKMLAICSMYYERRDTIQLLTGANNSMLYLIENRLSHKMLNNLKKTTESTFVAGGVSSVMIEWGKQGYIEKPDDIARKIAKLIHKSMQ